MKISILLVKLIKSRTSVYSYILLLQCHKDSMIYAVWICASKPTSKTSCKCPFIVSNILFHKIWRKKDRSNKDVYTLKSYFFNAQSFVGKQKLLMCKNVFFIYQYTVSTGFDKLKNKPLHEILCVYLCSIKDFFYNILYHDINVKWVFWITTSSYCPFNRLCGRQHCLQHNLTYHIISNTHKSTSPFIYILKEYRNINRTINTNFHLVTSSFLVEI